MGVGVQGSLLSAIPKLMLFGTPPIPDTGRLFVYHKVSTSYRVSEVNRNTLATMSTVFTHTSSSGYVYSLSVSNTVIYVTYYVNGLSSHEIRRYDLSTFVLLGTTSIKTTISTDTFSGTCANNTKLVVVTGSGTPLSYTFKYHTYNPSTMVLVNTVEVTGVASEINTQGYSCDDNRYIYIRGTNTNMKVSTFDPTTYLPIQQGTATGSAQYRTTSVTSSKIYVLKIVDSSNQYLAVFDWNTLSLVSESLKFPQVNVSQIGSSFSS